MASGIGVAMVALGAAAIIAAPFTGGMSLSVFGASMSLSTALLAAGTVVMGAGTALSATADQPEPISQVHRQLATTSDAESPWEWVYGEVIKGSAIAWRGIGGGQDEYNGTDFVIACHPCEELLGFQIGEWYFPVTTNFTSGTTTANGRGVALNTDERLTDDWPTDWLVCVEASQWVTSPQDESQSGGFHHIALKWSPGDRTATDPFMATLFGTKYSGINRKYIGHTVVSMVTLTNDELGTGTWQEVLFHVRGKNNILDHNGANPGYTKNAALVFADICREWLDIPVTDIVGVNPSQTLQGLAAECDSTTWAGSTGIARYDFNGVIRDDIEPVEALKMVTEHMAGGYSERGDKIALFTGTVKPVWADGPITYDDVVAVGDALAITIIPPDEDAWANTLVPHFIVRRPENEDGELQLYGRMEPAKHDVSSSTYVTEDQGVVLRQDIKFPACITAKQAKDRAWTVLRQMRLGASMDVVLKKRASVLEKGDVAAFNFPDFFPNGTLFQVASKAMILGPDTFGVRLGLVRYEHAIYDHSLNPPTEDAIGVVGKRRSSFVPVVTGLAAEVLEAWVHPKGHIVCNVSVTWNLVPNFLVRSAGDIRVAWKKQSQSRWRATTVPGDEIETELSGLMQGVPYHIKVRAEGAPTAGRTGKPKGKWSTILSFTPESGFNALPGAPGTALLGENAINNGNFEGGINEDGTPVGWGYQLTAPAVFSLNATGGKFGPHRLRLIMNGSTADQYFRTDGEGTFGGLIEVEPGQRWEFVWWIDSNIDPLDDDPVNEIMQLQFYNETGTFVDTQEVTRRTVTSSDNGTWYRLRGTHTVPAGRPFMRPQFRVEPTGTTSDQTFIQSDGLKAKRVLGGTSTILTTTKTLNGGNTGVGDVWTDCRSITGATPGDPVRLVAQFEVRCGAEFAGSDQQIEVRMVRTNTNDTNLVVVSTGELRGDTRASGLAAYGPWFTVVMDSVDDSGDVGEYKWIAQFRCTGINGQAQVKNRGIYWSLGEESPSAG
jgi:hypothetical protein